MMFILCGVQLKEKRDNLFQMTIQLKAMPFFSS